ncbi:MAG: hypothetical protein JNL82_06565 [Myxococcales bacterium]|nr:hypothetical protein [Myxococcales bacterium]
MFALAGPLCLAGALAGCTEGGDPVAEEPNKDVPYRGVDGPFTSDPLAAECPDDPRNPGRVVLDKMETMSFYEDREGTLPLAESCRYKYVGHEGDPHYFPETLTSVWLVFELTGGDAGCEDFTHVVMRPPHGDGDIKHMHLRYGDASTTAAALLDMSGGDYEDADVCNPWWSVYCTAGAEACDG